VQNLDHNDLQTYAKSTTVVSELRRIAFVTVWNSTKLAHRNRQIGEIDKISESANRQYSRGYCVDAMGSLPKA